MLKKYLKIFILMLSTLLLSFSVIYAVEWDKKADKNDLTDKSFEINVWELTPWLNPSQDTTEKNVNFLLGTIIQKLMIVISSLSVLTMVIWWWFLVLHNWKDDILSKWKTIFTAGIIALVVSLSSYFLIVIIRSIIY
jgi:hypothetical protein